MFSVFPFLVSPLSPFGCPLMVPPHFPDDWFPNREFPNRRQPSDRALLLRINRLLLERYGRPARTSRDRFRHHTPANRVRVMRKSRFWEKPSLGSYYIVDVTSSKVNDVAACRDNSHLVETHIEDLADYYRRLL
jgi:hypothetical protein